jgi:hypothetical protein
MTNEERKALVERLRTSEGSYQTLHATMDVAAIEIERLMGEVKKGHAVTHLAADVRALRQQIEHYHGKWGKR